MDPGKGSENREAPGGDPTKASRGCPTSAGVIIDFHSAEFNRTDNLNDSSGNYRIFQPLGGIITADMRHQMERLKPENGITASDAVAPIPPDRERKAGEAECPGDAGAFTVISRGRTLIIDPDSGCGRRCAETLHRQGLECALWIAVDEPSRSPQPRPASCLVVEADAISISGAFGGFSVTVVTKGAERPLPEGSGAGVSHFDLVLDLRSTPAYPEGRRPAGYYGPGADPAALSEAMAELPRMKGRFRRPRFVTFLQNRCFHGRSRTRNCLLCLEICPFGAIQSANRSISIDPNRCQGCGGCAMVCPAEAIRMVHPSRAELLERLRKTLAGPAAGSPPAPVLEISDSEAAEHRPDSGAGGAGNGGRLLFTVEQIGHAGWEMLLAALAHGAGQVVLACGDRNPPAIRATAERQVRMGRAVMRGLGMPEERIRFVLSSGSRGSKPSASAGTPGEERPETPCSRPRFPIPEERRARVSRAIGLLQDRSGAQKKEIPLPVGSPYGAVKLDPAACTLCMACAASCPAGALLADGSAPRLKFVESRCHQCGLCEEVCPEGALSLIPRILCDPEASEYPALLHEAEPLRCIQCGLPFASQAMITRIRNKLDGHWMYLADRQLRRLRMCRTCRTQDSLDSRELNSWNRT